MTQFNYTDHFADDSAEAHFADDNGEAPMSLYSFDKLVDYEDSKNSVRPTSNLDRDIEVAERCFNNPVCPDVREFASIRKDLRKKYGEDYGRPLPAAAPVSDEEWDAIMDGIFSRIG